MDYFTEKTIITLVASFFTLVAGVLGINAWRNVEVYQKIQEVSSVNQLQPNILVNENPQTNTSTWKTYRNDKFGFEIKYPPGWQGPTKEDCELTQYDQKQVREECLSQIGYPASGDEVDEWPSGFFNIQIFDSPSDTDLKLFAHFITENLAKTPKSWISSERAFTFKGHAAYELNILGESKAVVISLPQRYAIMRIDFPISIGEVFLPKSVDYIRTHQMIFDSIKFIDTQKFDTLTGSSDFAASVPKGWKTYRKYGLEVKYPPGWHVNSEFPDVEIASVSKAHYIHGVGYPQFGAAWMVIHPIPCKNDCSEGEQIVDVGTQRPIVEITKTKDYQAIGIKATITYVMTFTYWKDDRNEPTWRRIFDEALSTFRFIEPTRASR